MAKSTKRSVKISTRMRQARESRNITQAQLAEMTGLMPSAVSHFEAGRRAPSVENLWRLADALGMSIDELVGRAEKTEGAGPTMKRLLKAGALLSPTDQKALIKIADVLRKRS